MKKISAKIKTVIRFDLPVNESLCKILAILSFLFLDELCWLSQLQDVEQGLNITDDKVNEEAGSKLLQQKKSLLLQGMKHKVKAVSPNGILENRALDGSSKLTSNACVEGDKRAEQSPFVKKEFKKPLEDLLLLQCNFAKLQEEVAYERAESDATVTTYKTLWREAQEALNVSRLEIEKLRTELAGLQRDFTNLKHSGTHKLLLICLFS